MRDTGTSKIVRCADVIIRHIVFGGRCDVRPGAGQLLDSRHHLLLNAAHRTVDTLTIYTVYHTVFLSVWRVDC